MRELLIVKGLRTNGFAPAVVQEPATPPHGPGQVGSQPMQRAASGAQASMAVGSLPNEPTNLSTGGGPARSTPKPTLFVIKATWKSNGEHVYEVIDLAATGVEKIFLVEEGAKQFDIPLSLLLGAVARGEITDAQPKDGSSLTIPSFKIPSIRILPIGTVGGDWHVILFEADLINFADKLDKPKKVGAEYKWLDSILDQLFLDLCAAAAKELNDLFQGRLPTLSGALHNVQSAMDDLANAMKNPTADRRVVERAVSKTLRTVRERLLADCETALQETGKQTLKKAVEQIRNNLRRETSKNVRVEARKCLDLWAEKGLIRTRNVLNIYDGIVPAKWHTENGKRSPQGTKEIKRHRYGIKCHEDEFLAEWNASLDEHVHKLERLVKDKKTIDDIHSEFEKDRIRPIPPERLKRVVCLAGMERQAGAYVKVHTGVTPIRERAANGSADPWLEEKLREDPQYLPALLQAFLNERGICKRIRGQTRLAVPGTLQGAFTRLACFSRHVHKRPKAGFGGGVVRHTFWCLPGQNPPTDEEANREIAKYLVAKKAAEAKGKVGPPAVAEPEAGHDRKPAAGSAPTGSANEQPGQTSQGDGNEQKIPNPFEKHQTYRIETSAASMPASGQPENVAEADLFLELRAFAEEKLKGNQQRVILLACRKGGSIPLTVLAAEFKWSLPCDGTYNSLQGQVNEKLRSGRVPWILRREGSKATLKHLAQK